MVTYSLREVVGWCVELGSNDSRIHDRMVDLYHCLGSRVYISGVVVTVKTQNAPWKILPIENISLDSLMK
jgi:hypothetical protein